ncbi:MAG: hypothetical protein R2836_03195 [Chitinophagales bacterium]
MRGKHISKPIEELVTEVKNLVNKGVKEIMLIAQELTYYGLDIYKKRSLEVLYWILCVPNRRFALDKATLRLSHSISYGDYRNYGSPTPKFTNYLDIPFATRL